MAKKIRNTVAECKECGATADEVFLERIKGSEEYICDDCAADLGIESNHSDDDDDDDDEKFDNDDDSSEPEDPAFIDEKDFYATDENFVDDDFTAADDPDFY